MRKTTVAPTLLLLAVVALAACEDQQTPSTQPQAAAPATQTIAPPVQDVTGAERDLTLPVGDHDWTSEISVGQARAQNGALAPLGTVDPTRPILIDMVLTEAPEGIVGRAEIRRGTEVLAETQVPVNRTSRRANLEITIPESSRGSDDTELVILVGGAEQERIPLDMADSDL